MEARDFSRVRLHYKPNDYYGTPGVRETCHELKEGINFLTTSKETYNKAIIKVAEFLRATNILTQKDYLVPAPQHTGKAEYTLDIAKILSADTGATVLNILGRTPSETWYRLKKKKIPVTPEFYLKTSSIPEKGRLFFVDNVIDTGITFRTANILLGGRLNPLVYATVNKSHREITLMI